MTAQLSYFATDNMTIENVMPWAVDPAQLAAMTSLPIAIRTRNYSGGSTGSFSSASSSYSSQGSSSPDLNGEAAPVAGQRAGPRAGSSRGERGQDRAAASGAQKNVNPARYKTELCRPYEESGHCKYGDKCQFAHGGTEQRSLSRHPKYKTDLCRTYHTTGFCPYGPRCHFIHNEDELKLGEITHLKHQQVLQQVAQQVAAAQQQAAALSRAAVVADAASRAAPAPRPSALDLSGLSFESCSSLSSSPLALSPTDSGLAEDYLSSCSGSSGVPSPPPGFSALPARQHHPMAAMFPFHEPSTALPARVPMSPFSQDAQQQAMDFQTRLALSQTPLHVDTYPSLGVSRLDTYPGLAAALPRAAAACELAHSQPREAEDPVASLAAGLQSVALRAGPAAARDLSECLRGLLAPLGEAPAQACDSPLDLTRGLRLPYFNQYAV